MDNSRVKIKAINPRVPSRLYVPIDGLISIAADGIAEVSAACADALIKGTKDWTLVGEWKDPAQNGTDGSNAGKDAAKGDEGEGADAGSDISDEPGVQELEADLSAMTTKQLQEYAAAAGIDEKAVKAAKNKAALVQLILDAAAEVVEEEADDAPIPDEDEPDEEPEEGDEGEGEEPEADEEPELDEEEPDEEPEE